MRFLLLSFALLAGACASTASAPTPDAASSAPASGAASAAAPSPALLLLRAAGHARDAPTRADVERILGEPAIARQDGAGAALTYRLQSCALLLLFEADPRNTQRLTMVHANARRAGAPAPSLEQCAAEAPVR
jgi:hypothetical protein